jgi:hypothetical protein
MLIGQTRNIAGTCFFPYTEWGTRAEPSSLPRLGLLPYRASTPLNLLQVHLHLHHLAWPARAPLPPFPSPRLDHQVTPGHLLLERSSVVSHTVPPPPPASDHPFLHMWRGGASLGLAARRKAALSAWPATIEKPPSCKGSPASIRSYFNDSNCSPTTADARFLPYTRSSQAHLPLGAAQHVFEVMCIEKVSMIWLLLSSYCGHFLFNRDKIYDT